MVVGQPLHYYYPYKELVDFNAPYYSRCLLPHTIMESSDEYPMTISPTNSTQSDSDNSISSIEVPSQSIEIPKKDDKKQCLWQNCHLIFVSLSDLASHVAKCHSSSGAGGLFYCGWEGCPRNNKGFNARYKMLVHVRTHTNEKPHKCYQCEKSFSRAENLKIHSRSHSGEKPYVCPVSGCTKAYSNSSDRFKHTRTHSVEKPYACKVPGCPKRYTDPSSLRKHVKTYKHFITENRQNGGTNQDSKMMPDSTDDKLNEKERIIENHVPVIKLNNYNNNNNEKMSHYTISCSNDIYKFSGSFVDIKNDSYRFSENYEKQRLYRPYAIDSMDIDIPLDLSLRRNI